MSIYKNISDVKNMYILVDIPTSFSYDFTNKTISNLQQDGWTVDNAGDINISASGISGTTVSALTHPLNMEGVSSILTISYTITIGAHYETQVKIGNCGSAYNNYDLQFLFGDGQSEWFHQSMSGTVNVTLTYNYSTGACSCQYGTYVWDRTFDKNLGLAVIKNVTSLVIHPGGCTLSSISMNRS